MSTNYIRQVTDTDGTTHDLLESVDTRIFRATCSTAAGTAAKVATLDDSTNYTLAAGVRVAVTFTYGNSAATPTLNVNSGGAKTIVTPTAVATLTSGNGTTYNTWGPYETVIFTYNGTYWVKGGTGYSIYNAYALANSKTANTGTVTQVTAGTGLSIGSTSGGNFTTTGTINHTNSVTAQTTQAVYPIKIDAQGHISAYGSAVTIPTVPSNIVNTITTTAGTHTAISSATGTVSFNIPTNTSHLTNDSGFITSDTNVTSTAVTAASTYYLVGSSSSSTTTGGLNKHESIKANVTADSNTSGSAGIYLGNSTAMGTSGAKYGYIRLYGNTAYYVDLRTESSTPTANRTIYLPSYAGAMYLTCTSTTNAVGGATTAPVYVTATGQISAVTSIPYSLISSAPVIVTGRSSQVTINSSSSTTVTVTYSGFSSAPKVMGTLYNVSSAANQLVMYISTAPTTTQTVFTIRNNGTASRTAYIDWIAVEV